jgi:hypothetical protein
MAVGMLLDIPGGTAEMYEAINQQMFGTSTPAADRLPEALIFHTAGAAAGGWRVFDVWESREAFDRFFREQVGPAMQALGDQAPSGPPPEPQIYELANYQRGRAG